MTPSHLDIIPGSPRRCQNPRECKPWHPSVLSLRFTSTPHAYSQTTLSLLPRHSLISTSAPISLNRYSHSQTRCHTTLQHTSTQSQTKPLSWTISKHSSQPFKLHPQNTATLTERICSVQSYSHHSNQTSSHFSSPRAVSNPCHTSNSNRKLSPLGRESFQLKLPSSNNTSHSSTSYTSRYKNTFFHWRQSQQGPNGSTTGPSPSIARY